MGDHRHWRYSAAGEAGPHPGAHPGSAEQRRLLDDPVLLAVPPALAAARGLVPNEVVAPGDYAREPWLVPRRAESCHEMIQRACDRALSCLLFHSSVVDDCVYSSAVEKTERLPIGGAGWQP